MLDETAIAYAEVDEILNLLEDDYINKVPENVKRFKRSSIRANRRIGAASFEKSITNSKVRKPETQKAVLTMEERKERSKLIAKEKFRTITKEEMERLAELNNRQAIYDQQERQQKNNGMGMGR